MRRSQRSRFTALLAAGLLGAGLFASAGSAAAAPLSPSSAGEARAATVFPPCLHTRTWDNWAYAYVEVTNECSGPHRFRVRWEGATDSVCVTLRPGERFQDSAVEPAWFAGLYAC